MFSPRTPSKNSLARKPSIYSSFARCFGASMPISPRRSGGHGLLEGQACVGYRRLGFDADDEEDAYTDETTAQEQEGPDGYVLPRREWHFSHQGKHFTLREEAENGLHCASHGGKKHGRERKALGKPATQRNARERARMECNCTSEVPEGAEAYALDQQGDEHEKERKDIRKLAKLWSTREKDIVSSASEAPKKEVHCCATDIEEANVYARQRKGIMKLSKLWTMREKARRRLNNTAETHEEEHNSSEEEADEYGRERNVEVHLGKHVSVKEREKFDADSSKRESLCRKAREACGRVLESARRGSPHLSELFVGNQLLMQVAPSSSFNARRARNVAPSAGFQGDPPLTSISPPSSLS